MNKKKIILIIGPTATGKTKLSINLGLKFNLPIVNADSLLFYKELTIGVAKPTPAELAQVPHYLIDLCSITTPVNAKIYRDLALPLLEELWQKFPAVIISGGSGFYLRALLYGMYESKTTNAQILNESNTLYENEGILPFLEILKIHDHPSYLKLHPNDHYRIRRAVEHWWATKTPISEAAKLQSEKNNELPFWQEQNWELLPLYLDFDKTQHENMIRLRTAKMIQEGLIEEVQSLLEKFSGHEKPLQSIGYKETQEFIKSEIKTKEELQEKIVISTRQLAKSQRTWFAKVEKIHLPSTNTEAEAQSLVAKFLI